MLVDVREAAHGEGGGEGEENSGWVGWQDVEFWRPGQKASWQRGALWLLRRVQLCFGTLTHVSYVLSAVMFTASQMRLRGLSAWGGAGYP